MTKKELIKSIIENPSNTMTESELEKKTNKELTRILRELEGDTVISEDSVQEDNGAEEAIKEQMQKEIEAKVRAEMEEKIKAELEAKIKAELEAKQASESKSRKEIDRYRLVPVMNMTNGRLVYVSRKSGAVWTWGSYGDVDEMEFHELQTMRTSSRAFLSEPLIMVLDEEVASYFALDKIYENFLDLDDLDKIFRMNNNDFAEFIEKVPKSMVVTIVSRARQLVQEEKLDSMWKVKYLNEKFNTDIGQRRG